MPFSSVPNSDIQDSINFSHPNYQCKKKHFEKTTQKKNKALLGSKERIHQLMCAHTYTPKNKKKMPIPFKIFSFHNMIRAAQMTTKINTLRRELLFNFPFDCYHNKTKLLIIKNYKNIEATPIFNTTSSLAFHKLLLLHN